jgi:hypothetical protein
MTGELVACRGEFVSMAERNRLLACAALFADGASRSYGIWTGLHMSLPWILDFAMTLKAHVSP